MPYGSGWENTDAAEVGIRIGIGELEKQTGVPIGDILDGIFGKKRKKRREG